MNEHDQQFEQARALLLEDATTAGLLPPIDPHAMGVSLESADDFVLRMRRDAFVRDNVVHLTSRRRRWPVLVAAAAAVSAIAVGVGIVQPWGTPVASAGTPAILDFQFANASKISYASGEEPTTTLLELSRAAASDTTDYGSGPSQHIVTDNWFTNADNLKAVTLIPQINETWTNADGSFRLTERRGDPLAPDGRGAPQGGSWTKLPIQNEDKQPAKSLDPDHAAKLPTTPGALRQALVKELECSDPNPGTSRSLCLYAGIRTMFTSYVVSPKLASAIWAMLADEKDFRLLGRVEDRAGREGVGISIIDDGNTKQRLIFIIDPDTGQLLGDEDVLIEKTKDLDVEVPAILSFTAFLESRYTALPGA